ncbi:MAG: hypothetical protein GX868_06245, partial [Actinobacteria bacterium]|nr:hypothetical protein [Actinomycetota bacterium]
MRTSVTKPAARVRAMAIGAVLATAAVVAAGCSDDEPTLDDLGITDEPASVIATALIDGDPTAVLGTEQLATFIQRKLVPSGYSWADAECAVDAVIDIVGADAFDRLPLYKSNTLAADHAGITEAAEACESPETSARRNNSVTRDDITVQQPIPGPDPDADAVRSGEEAFFERGAALAGLSAEELSCIRSRTIDAWNDEDWVAYAQA